jgi:hypothetical protein
VAAELTTPTGAALVKTTATSFGPLPEMTVRAVGYGAGSRDLEGQANLLRVILGDHQSEPPGSRQLECDRVVVLETNIDDSTPQQLADCADRLMSAGALDVFQIPCVMKKGRPGILFTVVAAESKTLSLEDILFRHTSSIGVRRRVLDRHKLPRRCVVVETEFGPIRGKVVDLPDGDRRFSVEDEDARAAAASYRVSAATVRHTALESWLRTR